LPERLEPAKQAGWLSEYLVALALPTRTSRGSHRLAVRGLNYDTVKAYWRNVEPTGAKSGIVIAVVGFLKLLSTGLGRLAAPLFSAPLREVPTWL